MLQKDRLKWSIRPIVHCVCEQFHRYRIHSQEISDKYYLLTRIESNKIRSISQGEAESDRTFSIFWFIAHSLAMDPMLFVMVTSVALAKSSFDTLLLRSLLFICPKLIGMQKCRKSLKYNAKFRTSCEFTLRRLDRQAGRTARSHRHRCLGRVCRRSCDRLSSPIGSPPRMRCSRSANSRVRGRCRRLNCFIEWENAIRLFSFVIRHLASVADLPCARYPFVVCRTVNGQHRHAAANVHQYEWIGLREIVSLLLTWSARWVLMIILALASWSHSPSSSNTHSILLAFSK